MSIPTIQDWRKTLQTVKERYVQEQLNSITETDKWDSIDAEGILRIFDGIDERFYNRGYSTWRIKLTGSEKTIRVHFLREITASPLRTKLMLAWMYAMSDKIGEMSNGFQGFSFDFDDLEIRFNSITQYAMRTTEREVTDFEIV